MTGIVCARRWPDEQFHIEPVATDTNHTHHTRQGLTRWFPLAKRQAEVVRACHWASRNCDCSPVKEQTQNSKLALNKQPMYSVQILNADCCEVIIWAFPCNDVCDPETIGFMAASAKQPFLIWEAVRIYYEVRKIAQGKEYANKVSKERVNLKAPWHRSPSFQMSSDRDCLSYHSEWVWFGQIVTFRWVCLCLCKL